MEGLQNNASSDIKLIDRSKLKITGVIKLLELSAKEVLVKTNLGDLLIKGSNIEMLSLNDNDNTINLIGKNVEEAVIELDKYLDDAYISKIGINIRSTVGKI